MSNEKKKFQVKVNGTPVEHTDDEDVAWTEFQLHSEEADNAGKKQQVTLASDGEDKFLHQS